MNDYPHLSSDFLYDLPTKENYPWDIFFFENERKDSDEMEFNDVYENNLEKEIELRREAYNFFASDTVAQRVLESIEEFFKNELPTSKNFSATYTRILAYLSDVNFLTNCNKLDSYLREKSLILQANLIKRAIEILQNKLES